MRRALSTDTGDVLVFLPGIGEIRRVERMLLDVRPGRSVDVDVYALAGALTLEEQDRALAPSPPGRRRVVLSTDIAETSLTVDGVRIVVDAGLAREPRFDVRTGLSRLTTVTTSRASAEQRAGRAGRTEPGVAYRLWSKIEHGSRQRHRAPEILQADLAGFALELAAWGIDARSENATGGLAFIDPPPPTGAPAGTGAARRTLMRSTRLDGSITQLGRAMLRLPVHPRLARMVAVEQSMLACVIACIVDERDILRGRPDDLPGRSQSARRRRRRVRRTRRRRSGRRATDSGTGRSIWRGVPASIPHSARSIPTSPVGRCCSPTPIGSPVGVVPGSSSSGPAARPGCRTTIRSPTNPSSSPPTSMDGASGHGSGSPLRSTPPTSSRCSAPPSSNSARSRGIDDRDELVDVVERRLGAIQLGRTTSHTGTGRRDDRRPHPPRGHLESDDPELDGARRSCSATA